MSFDANGVPFDLSEPDNTIPERRTLLPTNALQSMLLDLAAEGASSGLLAGGPRAGGLGFVPDPANPGTAGTLNVSVLLAKKAGVPAPPPDAAIVVSTFDPGFVSVSRLDATGWTDVTPAAAVVTYDGTTSPPHIQIVFPQDLAAGTPFVLSFQPDPARPTVDENGSPLPPFIRRFRFALDAGSLALDPAV